jgi:DNA-binding NtrC family response regulator
MAISLTVTSESSTDGFLIAHVPAIANKRHLRILHVEDDAIDARILSRLADRLSKFVCEISRVDSPAAAGLALSMGGFDVCIMDFWLGDQPSLKLLSKISATTPIVLVTGMTDSQTHENALRAGTSVVLTKSRLGIDSLEEALERAMRQSRAL